MDGPVEEGSPEEAQVVEIWAISPHFTNHHFDVPGRIDDQIAVFADRVRGWQLDIAERLAETERHGGFAVLGIVLSYFEAIAKYREGFEGRGASEYHFMLGARKVFEPLLLGGHIAEEQLTTLWRDARNGIYHAGMTGLGIILTSEAPELLNRNGISVRAPIWSAGDGMVGVNPSLLVHWLQVDFSQYIAELLRPENQTVREKFQRCFVSRG